MSDNVQLARTRHELEAILAEPGAPLISELLDAAQNPQTLRDRAITPLLLQAAERYLTDIQGIPQLTYSLYRRAERTDPRLVHKPVYQEKRAKMTAAALRVLLGDDPYLNTLQDYVWSTCEETTWVPPQHLRAAIDLYAAGTGFDLAEIIVVFEDKLEEGVRRRVRAEIERRIFTPYLEGHEELWWYRGYNNWNGVCNGAVGAMFLLLEQDQARLAHALEVVLDGLDVFLATAFEADGASGEGVGYWHYGLSNLICFGEMLRRRTGGAIDILASERLKAIARYPLRVMLSPGRYFAFSDCSEKTAFNPGLVMRLAERTGVSELLGVLTEPAQLARNVGRFHTVWRSMLWWDGKRPQQVAIADAWLKSSAVTRLVAQTSSGVPVVLASKAGHNGVSHNHNDVGSFVLHVDGETVLCDPERGLYDLYRRFGHDANIFANSFGHSVPRIGGSLQSRGAQFRGQITRYETDGSEKRVEMAIEGAYEVPGLESALRSLRLSADGELILEDTFTFSGGPLPVEEAFVTWCNTMVSGATALLVGEKHVLQLTIEEPADAVFGLEVLKEESEANRKPVPLKRVSFTIEPSEAKAVACVRAKVLP